MNNNRQTSFSTRLYASLLAFYPRAHREEYAEPMRQVFADQLRAAGGRGWGAVLALWLRTLPDLAWTAVVEHVTAPGASAGLLEAAPGAPLPWKGVLLVLLPALVYLVSQVAQLAGTPWYLTVYYRAAFLLILPPLAVWIAARRFPLWGLIPVGLLFRLAQEMGYHLLVLYPGAFSSNPFINNILTTVKSVKFGLLTIALILAGGALLLGWLTVRKSRPGRGFFLWTGVYLLIFLVKAALSLHWALPYLAGDYPYVTPDQATAMFRDTLGWDLFNAAALLLLVFIGAFFARRHGPFTLLVLLGYFLPTQVIGIPWDPNRLGLNMVFIGAGVLAFRTLLSFAAPLWMARRPTASGKTRTALILAGAALALHAAMQFYPGVYYQIGQTLPFNIGASILLDDLRWFSALPAAAALYAGLSHSEIVTDLEITGTQVFPNQA